MSKTNSSPYIGNDNYDPPASRNGDGDKIKEGDADSAMGVATLVGGTATVNSSIVTAKSRIFLQQQALGTVTAAKAMAVTARVVGTSFTITSADATDTSVVAWEIVEPK